MLHSVPSTAGVVVGKRVSETGLLRTIGATPRQVRRLVQAEMLVVCVVAATCGALLAAVGGPALPALLRSGDLASGVNYAGSVISLFDAAASWC